MQVSLERQRELIPRWLNLGFGNLSIVSTQAAREAAASIEVEAEVLYGIEPRYLAEWFRDQADCEEEWAFWELVLSIIILRETARSAGGVMFEVLDGVQESQT